MVSKENIEALATGVKSVASVAAGTASKLTAEALNLFIIDSTLQVMKFAAVFIIFYMVKRFIDFLSATGFSETKARALKLSLLILSITFFTTQSIPHLTEIAKACVSPNIFLAEKGTAYIERLKAMEK